MTDFLVEKKTSICKGRKIDDTVIKQLKKNEIHFGLNIFNVLDVSVAIQTEMFIFANRIMGPSCCIQC